MNTLGEKMDLKEHLDDATPNLQLKKLVEPAFEQEPLASPITWTGGTSGVWIH